MVESSQDLEGNIVLNEFVQDDKPEEVKGNGGFRADDRPGAAAANGS